ncbi:putative membrane protein [Mesorhizobium sp. SOD10]|nr:putative membrane protein [Mesorhizobium sp. SOD10]
MHPKAAAESKGYVTPTTPAAEGLAPALARNIEALVERRKRDAKAASLEQRAAAAISSFAGSMIFVYIHLVIFGAWIGLNLGIVTFIKPFDPSLVILAMFASVEAIFLSTFVLINQNRMAAEDDARADLDLQVSLLNEHETTKLIKLVEEIAKRLDVNTEADEELKELKRDVAPEAVLDKIEEVGERATRN